MRIKIFTQHAQGVRLEHVVVIGLPADTPSSLSAFIDGASADEPGVAVDEGDPLGLTFTGGTTGVPKGVVVSHRARGISALTALAEFGLAEPDVAAVTTPLFHVMGLFIWFHAAVACGATSVFLSRWQAEDFISAVHRHSITTALLVPTQLGDLMSHPGLDPATLRSLERINHAGMPMPGALIERVSELLPWAELIDNYGTSETGPLTARREAHRCPRATPSTGRRPASVHTSSGGPCWRPGRRGAPRWAGSSGPASTRSTRTARTCSCGSPTG